jgi:hypothetical protein
MKYSWMIHCSVGVFARHPKSTELERLGERYQAGATVYDLASESRCVCRAGQRIRGRILRQPVGT